VIVRRDILCWELVGIVFIVVLASVLHFVFEWSGGATPIAPIALAVLGILFVLPRSYPLQVQLFRDSITGGYGIVG
jgi:membrane protein implicated in regulation of membrane protease activity